MKFGKVINRKEVNLAFAKTYQQIALFLAMTRFNGKGKQNVVLALIAAASFFVIAIEKKVNK